MTTQRRPQSCEEGPCGWWRQRGVGRGLCMHPQMALEDGRAPLQGARDYPLCALRQRAGEVGDD